MRFLRENLDLPLDPDIRLVPGKHSNGRQATVHELVLGGESVSRLGVVHFQQRIGNAWLTMGGISGVETPEKHRKKGYARRCLINANRWMRQEGFDTAMLFGIGGYFYPKFGYTEAFPDEAHAFALTALDEAEIGRKVERKQAVYRPDKHAVSVLNIYRKNNETRTGIVERPGWGRHPRLSYSANRESRFHVEQPTAWNRFAHSGPGGHGVPPKAAVLLEGRRVVAFRAWREEMAGEFRVLEFGAAKETVFPDLLRAVCADAAKLGRERVFFHLPGDHPFVEYLQPFGVVSRTKYRRDGGAMVRLINVRTALEKIAPVLSARLQPVVCGRVGALLLRSTLDDVRLSWRNDKVTVGAVGAAGGRKRAGKSNGGKAAREETVRLTQEALCRLLYGARSAAALAADGTLKGSGRARDMLAVLFPVHHHHFWPSDYF